MGTVVYDLLQTLVNVLNYARGFFGETLGLEQERLPIFYL